jgi:hypothetical protein
MRVHEELHANGDVPKEEYDTALKVLNDAVVTERMRNWDSKQPELSDDPDVAELQKQVDVPRPMAEQAVKERRRRAIVEMPPSSKKVQSPLNRNNANPTLTDSFVQLLVLCQPSRSDL